jgi:hypothetical protein
MTLAAGSPYVVTVLAELTDSPTISTFDSLSLTVKNACTHALASPPVTRNSDLTTPQADNFINYAQVFNCPGETLAPTYTFSTLDWRFVIDSNAKKISWSIADFNADATFTITVLGRLQSPHTQTS